jgi:hypothetical protein
MGHPEHYVIHQDSLGNREECERTVAIAEGRFSIEILNRAAAATKLFNLQSEIVNLKSLPLPRWYTFQAHFGMDLLAKACRNGLSNDTESKNPRKIRCFPQPGGYKIAPAGIKPIF